MVAREYWWGREKVNGCGYKSVDPCNDETILYLDYSDDYKNAYVLKLPRTKHTYPTHKHTLK